jgi:hypothetical protein
MPVIRVDNEVYGELEKRVQGFNDTPNSVLRRLLGLKANDDASLPSRVTADEGRQTKGSMSAEKGSAPSGAMLTPQTTFRLPIIRILGEMDGRGRVSDVLHQVGQRMKSQLTRKDYELVPSGGDVQWRNRARWERKKMITDGLLKEDSPHGWWELTQEGWRYYRENVAVG